MKETTINILVQQYETFKMHSNEAIGQMFTRFNTISNDLYGLSMSYTSIELVNKILGNLLKVYQRKVLEI